VVIVVIVVVVVVVVVCGGGWLWHVMRLKWNLVALGDPCYLLVWWMAGIDFFVLCYHTLVGVFLSHCRIY